MSDCQCTPDYCSRREFRDHQGPSDGCMACADLDPGQACYALRELRRGLGAEHQRQNHAVYGGET